jgi:hypothetical protein
MENLYKFGWLPNGEGELPYDYPNIWAREKQLVLIASLSRPALTTYACS